MFLPMRTFGCFVLPFSQPTYFVEPRCQLFRPTIWVFGCTCLTCFYYASSDRFFQQEVFYPCCLEFVIISEFICDLFESGCKLICGGVRLPNVRTAHILDGVFSSYPCKTFISVCRLRLRCDGRLGICPRVWGGGLRCGMWCVLNSPTHIRIQKI
jgi:hypothetical protein